MTTYNLESCVKKCLLLLSFCIALFASSSQIHAASLSEKRAALAGRPFEGDDESLRATIKAMNHDLAEKKALLLKLTTETHALYEETRKEQKDEEATTNLLTNLLAEKLHLIEQARNEIKAQEGKWKDLSKDLLEEEDEGLWHQPDTTIGQLVIDYGSLDHVYLMPPEIGGLKVHISSQLTVPRASWNEMLELILASYGIGVKQLNTFVRQLFFLRLNQSAPATICDKREELLVMPLEARVCYVITPPPTELRRVYQFLEKFVPQEQMTFQMIGSNIVMVGLVKEILELHKVYDFLSSPKQTHEYKLVTLQKAQSEEIAQILHSLFEGDAMRSFGEGGDKHAPFFPGDTNSGFRVITLKHPAQSLFLLGRRDQIEKAVQIISDIESRINEAQEKTVYWYPCKHSEAEELAKVLSQVYAKMVSAPSAFTGQKAKDFFKKAQDTKTPPKPNNEDNGYTPPLVVPRDMVEPSDFSKKRSVEIHDNFIVDPKTNSIVIVVEAALLEKLKELLKLLDVAKKMVQLDVLLVEKKITDHSNFGMNLLRLGHAASHKHRTSLAWNEGKKKKEHHKGILHYSISRLKSTHLPAYDLAFNFLLTQENVQINANPSVVTINQTPAKIAVVEEISLNTGVVEIDTTKAAHLKDSYTRAQYGTTIQITPTIHSKAEGLDETNERKYITLATEIKFDTTDGRGKNSSRPDITTRFVKNEVRIADGETVILGGLRRKVSSDDRESIPFLGELPGVGKLFGTSSLSDNSTEMFIFITPRIVPDAGDEYRAMRLQELLKRPGDLPEFLEEIELAKRDTKRLLFERSLRMLFGKADAFNVSSRKP